MKLTKGKISKLYDKKKQSLKKHKKLKSSYKKRTFRNKRKVNLARKSLKRLHDRKYKGGAETDETPKDDTNKNINQSTMEENITESTKNLDTTSNGSVTNTTENPDESVTDYTENLDATTDESVINTTNIETTNKTTEGIQDIPIQPSENITNTDNVTDETTKKIPDETTYNITDEPVDKTSQKETNNKKNIQIKNSSNTELMNSFKNIANYLADVVSEKVSTSQYGEKPQNGFAAVNKAATTIGTFGGSKFKKLDVY